jgi:hypothetical protein
VPLGQGEDEAPHPVVNPCYAGANATVVAQHEAGMALDTIVAPDYTVQSQEEHEQAMRDAFCDAGGDLVDAAHLEGELEAAREVQDEVATDLVDLEERMLNTISAGGAPRAQPIADEDHGGRDVDQTAVAAVEALGRRTAQARVEVFQRSNQDMPLDMLPRPIEQVREVFRSQPAGAGFMQVGQHMTLARAELRAAEACEAQERWGMTTKLGPNSRGRHFEAFCPFLKADAVACPFVWNPGAAVFEDQAAEKKAKKAAEHKWWKTTCAEHGSEYRVSVTLNDRRRIARGPTCMEVSSPALSEPSASDADADADATATVNS